VVEVKGASAAALQTETSTVGDTVATDAISELPDVNHNPYYYATLQPGVAGRWQLMDNNSAMSFGIGIYSHDNWSAFSINGSTTFTANITVDGVDTQGAAWNESDINPAPESIQEVKTYTNDYDASVGRGQGAVAIVTKSGTDNFHGVVFGRLRNAALNANTFSNDVTGDSEAQYGYKPIAKPAFTVVYYGAAVGGPIKKDKAFFFASWQGMAHNTSNQDLLNVPMNNQAKGDFASPEGCPTAAAASAVPGATATANTLGTCVSVGGVATPIQLANPFIATPVAGLNGVYQHPLITGPAGVSDLSQVADPGYLYWAGFYPPANRFPTDQYNSNNYFNQSLETFRAQILNSRVDLNHGKQNFYFAGGIEVGNINTPSPWGKETPQFFYAPNNNNSQITALVHSHTPYGSIGDTITVSPTLIIDARLGVQRPHYLNQNPVLPGVNYNLFGMPANYQAILLQPGAAPDNGTTPIGQWSSLNDESTGHKNAHQTNWHAAASATKVKGNWTLKFGGEYLADLTNTPNPYYTGGYLVADGCGGCVFSNTSDASVSQNATAATQGLAYVGDAMMGAGWWYSPGYEQTIPALEEQYMALYSQNTWKVTPRLTLNLGLRWDLQPGPTDRFNRGTTWDPEGTNPIGAAAGFGAEGMYYFAGVEGHSRHLWLTEYTNFAPRLGLAYRLRDSTVIRGGYGVSFLPTNVGLNYGAGPYGFWPWGVGTTENAFGAVPSGAPIGPMENPAISPVALPVGPNPTAPQNYGVAVALEPYNYENGFVQQYNLFIERKVGGWLFSAGYSGSHGSRLPVEYYLNGENSTLLAAPSVNGSNVINCFHAGISCGPTDSSVAAAGGYRGTGSDPYTQQVTNPFNPTGTLPFQGVYLAKTIQRGLYDGAFPMFNGLLPEVSAAYSSYNSLQLEAKHQFGHGLMADVFYTWSKSLSDSYYQAEHNQAADTDVASMQWNQVDPHANRRYDIDDIPGRFVANIVYALPFGPGHNLNPSNKVAGFLVGGWTIGATEMDESGYPLDIYDNDPGSLDARPNRATNEPLLLPKIDQKWYNGTTPVTLPDGRIITPANFTFLKFNPDAFNTPVIPNPTNSAKYLNDTYWLGNSAINYSTIRDPSINNLNFSIRRNFKVTERLAIEFQANATNLLNHPNIETYTTDLGSSAARRSRNQNG